MHRSPVLPIVLTFVLLRATAALAAVQAPAEPLPVDPVTVVRTEKVRSVVDLGADSSVVIGHAVRQRGTCPAQADAFVEKLSGGVTVWRRGVHPGAGEGQLFAAPGGLDPDFVTASTVYGAAAGVGGDVVVAGEVILGWQDELGAPVATRGAFVVLLASDGTALAEAYLGVAPRGPSLTGCPSACDGLGGTGFEEIGIRGVTVGAAGEVVVTGWKRPTGAGGDADLMVASLAPDLGQVDWLTAPVSFGNDAGLAVTVDDLGGVFVTGYGQVTRDVVVARFTSSGVLADYALGGGLWDDEGRRITTDDVGNVIVHGIFTGSAVFDGVVLDGGGEGQSTFEAVYDSDLELVSLRKTSGGPPPSGLKSMGPHENPATDLAVVQGLLGTGGLEQIADSDDVDVHVYSLVTGPDTATYELETAFAVDPMAPVLGRLRVEAWSASCQRLTVSLGGGLRTDGTFTELGSIDLDPWQEPVVRFDIPESLATELGYPASGSLTTEPLRARTRVELEHQTVFFKGSAQGEDGSVDEITLETEYP